MSVSEVAQLKQRIAEEYQATMNGLSGLAAGIPQHRYIHQRNDNLLGCLRQLEAVVGEDETKRIYSEVLEVL